MPRQSRFRHLLAYNFILQFERRPEPATNDGILIRKYWKYINSQREFLHINFVYQVVGDLEEIFTPLQRGFLVDPDKCKENIDLLLGQIPQVFIWFEILCLNCFSQLNPQPAPDACFLPVVQAAAQAFDSCQRAGKLFLFHSSLPTVAAPGKLQNRDDRKLIGAFFPASSL